jgi:hypothetical protein
MIAINEPSLETCYDLIMDYLHKLNVVIASYVSQFNLGFTTKAKACKGAGQE